MWSVIRSILLTALLTAPLASSQAQELSNDDIRSLDDHVQDAKSVALSIAAELNMLEERLLYPSGTQVSIYLSVARQADVQPSAVAIQINGEPATNHIYSVKELDALLRTFKEAKRHMAIVVDEYGDVQGIVTLEDVLEELVGDIVDESDQPVEEVWLQQDGSVHALASIELRKLCKQLELDHPTDTQVARLGGLIMELLGRIPVEGDKVEWNNCWLEVKAASQWSAELVSISKKI